MTHATTMDVVNADAVAAAAVKAQEFAHRVVDFADYNACCKFFQDKAVDFDRANASGWTVLMSVCACERADLVGLVVDKTTNVACATIPNGTTVLHLAAKAPNPRVVEELLGTVERVKKLETIADACNRNGDTPLMMACVSKNVSAVRVLLETLNANPRHKNASGMTALMCASRLRDEREGPGMRIESEAIVDLLLQHGAEVNAVDTVGQQTALHFALLSRNENVVKMLLATKDIDLTRRNAAGHSPLELARKVQVDGLINAALESKWDAIEDEARLLSEKVAQELVDSSQPKAATERKKTKKKQSERKAMPTATTLPTQDYSSRFEIVEDEVLVGNGDDNVMIQTDEIVESLPVPPVKDTDAPAPSSTIPNDALENNSDEWVVATNRKNRRKEAVSAEKAKGHRSKASVEGNSAMSAKHSVHKSQRTKPLHAAEASRRPPLAAPSEKGAGKPVTKSNGTTTTNAPLMVDPAQSGTKQPSTQPSTPRPSSSQDELNTIFHSMFPIAHEMDIPVESFIAGASTPASSDLLNGLSISQVEVLQEAHLQAYHYLNERKIELTRVLEAQRLEAQLELRRQLYDMP